jgi:putative flippase GtrA
VTATTSRRRREAKRFFKFTIVGAIGAVVDFGTFNLLTAIFGVWSVAASVCSFSAAVTSNFLWNRHWVYPDSRSKPIRSQAVQFVLVNLVGLAIRTPVFAAAERPMIGLARSGLVWLSRSSTGPGAALQRLDPAVLGPNLALALAVIVVLFWNFAVNRFWTYSDVV